MASTSATASQLNLGDHVGDQIIAVRHNHVRACIDAHPVFYRTTGARQSRGAPGGNRGRPRERLHHRCVRRGLHDLVADCLPLLLFAHEGRAMVHGACRLARTG